MLERNGKEILHPKQPGFVLVTKAYKKYNLMKYGISHFYQFNAEKDMMSGIPDACVDILFCNKGSHMDTMVAGTLLKVSEVETSSTCNYFGIRFLPGYNPVGKQMKMNELVGHQEELNGMIDSSEREELLELIGLAETFEQKVEAYLTFYLKHYDREQYESYNLRYLLRKEMIESGGNIKLNDLQEKTGYSLRYLYNVIYDEFGMAPKELMRIIRFQKAIDDMTKNISKTDMTETALEAGYYDQSHFIKDFKEFTNYTPKKYRNSLMTNSYKEKLQIIKEV